jgi:hypothetical protein
MMRSAWAALALAAALFSAHASQAVRIDAGSAHILADGPPADAAEGRAVPSGAAENPAGLSSAFKPLTRSGRLAEKDIGELPNYVGSAARPRMGADGGGGVPIIDPPKRVAGYFKLNRTADAHM